MLRMTKLCTCFPYLLKPHQRHLMRANTKVWPVIWWTIYAFLLPNTAAYSSFGETNAKSQSPLFFWLNPDTMHSASLSVIHLCLSAWELTTKKRFMKNRHTAREMFERERKKKQADRWFHSQPCFIDLRMTLSKMLSDIQTHQRKQKKSEKLFSLFLCLLFNPLLPFGCASLLSPPNFLFEILCQWETLTKGRRKKKVKVHLKWRHRWKSTTSGGEKPSTLFLGSNRLCILLKLPCVIT